MKKFMAFVAVFLILLIVLLGECFSERSGFQLDTKYPNLSVSGLEVGKLTREQTAALLNDNGWEERISTPLTVTTVGGHSFSVDPVQAGLAADAKAVAEFVYDYGRDGNMFENFFVYLKSLLRPTELSPETKDADLDYIRSCIAQNEADIAAALGEAEYTPDYEGEQLVLEKGWGQLQLDEAGLEQAVVDAVRAGETELNYRRLASDLVSPDFDAILAALRQESPVTRLSRMTAALK